MCKKTFLTIGILALGMIFTSCSNDDDNDVNDGGGTSSAMPLPGSMVDGVRLAGYGNFGNVSYNPDGSISKVDLNGTSYKFVYESRATALGGLMLKAIIVSLIDEVYDMYEITDISFNSKGYVSQWTEHYGYDIGTDDYEITTQVCTPEYKSNRVSNINMDVKIEYSDGTDRNELDLVYTYDNGDLVSTSFTTYDGSRSVFSLGYNDKAPKNKYNIAPFPLCSVMGHSALSPAANLFAILGYLGEPSAHLPTSLTFTANDVEEGDDYYERMLMSYTTDDKDKVTAITYTMDGMSATCELTYFTQP